MVRSGSDERRGAPSGSTAPVAPVAVLLCRDRAVRAFLSANGLPQQHRVLLVGELSAVPDDLPARLPVVVLHDAGPAGCLLVDAARTALPGRRILDGGVPPRVVMAQSGALKLRQPDVSQDTLARLRAPGSLSEAELAWLAEGWWSPLAAVPPAPLLAAVTRALERATAAARADEDPAEVRRRALAVGFLTWPDERTA